MSYGWKADKYETFVPLTKLGKTLLYHESEESKEFIQDLKM